MEQQTKYEKRKLTLEDFPKEDSSPLEKAALNFFDSDVAKNPIKTIWKNPFGKALLIGGGTYIFLLAGGFIFRAGAYFMVGWNEFKDASNGSGSAPKSPPKNP